MQMSHQLAFQHDMILHFVVLNH